MVSFQQCLVLLDTYSKERGGESEQLTTRSACLLAAQKKDPAFFFGLERPVSGL